MENKTIITARYKDKVREFPNLLAAVNWLLEQAKKEAYMAEYREHGEGD